MSQPAVSALSPLPFELVYEDGIPMDSYAHVLQMNLLMELIHQVMAERGRDDFFVGGDMFVYYSLQQAQDIAADPHDRRYFRGPDLFFVNGGIDPQRDPLKRKAWVSWDENGRLPDLIVELLSPSTARIDRTAKKDLYGRIFRTPEYYLYDMDTGVLEAFRLAGEVYRPIKPNAQGRIWSEQLQLELGLWNGVYRDQETAWIRLFYPDGRMVPMLEERTQAEKARAESAEAEVARLRALLEQQGGPD